MRTSAVLAQRYCRLLAAALIAAGCLTLPATAQNKKSTPAPKSAPAPKPASNGARSGGTSSANHGVTTANHGPTTASHGITTNSRTTTTTGNRGVTTASRTTTTTRTTATTMNGRNGMVSSTRTTTTVSHPGGPVRTPMGSHEVRASNGAMVRTRADGRRADIHDERRGMDIHHGLNGERRISVERADHSRVFAERGHGYVQHPYMYHGREFGHRTYYDHGRYYDSYYRRYPYHGVYLDVYAPARYWGPGFYGWAYNPWAVPVAYSWGWGAAPWYGFYGAYFAPYPVYPSAAFWLTDYLVAASLQAAYAAQVAAAQEAAADQAAAAGGPPELSPDVKALIADEVKRQLALENQEAGQNAQNQDIDPGSSGIARMLGDGQPHVFIAGGSLDLVDSGGVECAISQGDVLEVQSAPPPDANGATAIILAIKGPAECHKADIVTVAFNDLQDMQNHMRETIDSGLGELQSKQGQSGLPQAPPSAQAAPAQAAFAAVAPPPDPNAATEIQQQSQAADQSEQEVASAAPAPADATAAAAAAPAPAPAPAAAPVTVSMGQTMDQVTSSMGQPTRIIDLGAKKIYVYKDMKVVFHDGKVSDVQ